MKELDIKLSYKCNNACVFCLNQDKRRLGKLSFSAIKSRIQDSAEEGLDKLIVSGGEPLIFDEFFELLNFAKKEGVERIEIQTNGRMLCYEDLVRRINKFSKLSFLVSLHFPRDTMYKKYCRSDGFYQVVEGIKNLVKYKLLFTVNTVLMKPNLSYLEELMGLLKEIGVGRVQYRFIDGKNVIDEYEKFVPRYEEVLPTLRKIVKTSSKVDIKIREIPLCILGREFMDHLAPPANPHRMNLTTDDKLLSDPEIVGSQFVLPKCDRCFYKENCKGIRKEYQKFYGDDEIEPVVIKPS